MKTTTEQRDAVRKHNFTHTLIAGQGIPCDVVRVSDLLDDLDEAERRIAYLESGFIHTCHDKCKNRDCMQTRRIEILEKALEHFDKIHFTESGASCAYGSDIAYEALAKSRRMGK